MEIKIFHVSRGLDIESEPSVFSSDLKTIGYGTDFSVQMAFDILEAVFCNGFLAFSDSSSSRLLYIK